RVAGINGEESIEITAFGADHHGLGVVRRPGVPYRMATGIARMAGLEWFFRRTAIEHLSAPGQRVDHNAIGKRIIPRRRETIFRRNGDRYERGVVFVIGFR